MTYTEIYRACGLVACSMPRPASDRVPCPSSTTCQLLLIYKKGTTSLQACRHRYCANSSDPGTFNCQSVRFIDCSCYIHPDSCTAPVTISKYPTTIASIVCPSGDCAPQGTCSPAVSKEDYKLRCRCTSTCSSFTFRAWWLSAYHKLFYGLIIVQPFLGKTQIIQTMRKMRGQGPEKPPRGGERAGDSQMPFTVWILCHCSSTSQEVFKNEV